MLILCFPVKSLSYSLQSQKLGGNKLFKGIIVHPDATMRISHTVKVPPLPPGFAYQLLHCVAQLKAFQLEIKFSVTEK